MTLRQVTVSARKRARRAALYGSAGLIALTVAGPLSAQSPGPVPGTAGTPGTGTATSAPPPATEVLPQDVAGPSQTSPAPASDPEAAPDSEIVVTGTSIRGVAPVGSNLISVGRAAIEKTGAVNTAEMLSTIPQLNSFNIIPEAQVLRSRTQGYALNIHRLGYYATLTLINGHRYAPSGGEVTFVDPAMIPSVAIERVELVPDGASGVYGSDAVAGVVNFVYRRPFDGIEANAQYGWGRSTLESTQLNFIAGKRWETGSLSLAAEFSRRVPPTFGGLGLKGDNRDRPGGRDLRSTNCAPGNVAVGGTTLALPNFTTPRNMCEANPTQQLYPEGSRYSGLLLGRKELGESLELYVEANYGYYESKQETGFTTLVVTVPRTNPYFQAPAGSTAGSVQVTRNSSGLFANRQNIGEEEQFGGTLGANYRLPGEWLLNAFVHFSQDENFSTVNGLNAVAAQTAANGTTTATAFNPFGDAGANNANVLAQIDDGYYTRNWARNKLFEASLKLDGPLFELPGGPIRAAIGLDYRYEDVSQIQDFGSRNFTEVVRDTFVDRNVYAAYGELNVPLFSADNAVTLIRSLQLSLSARHDRYPGLRNITNPKVGVTWKPIDDLTLQGSWGKSFVAPNLGALGGSYLIPFVQQNQSAIGLGIINLIHIAGGNAFLTPEYARTYSLGGKYAPFWLPGLRLGLTYFHVNYRDTQYQPQEGLNNPLFAQFLRERYPPGVILNVTPADVDALLTRYKFQGLFQPGTVWTTVTTSALVNAGVLRARGFDFEASYAVETGIGNFTADFNGTRMTTYNFQLLPTAEPVSQLDTQRAPRWSWRSSVNWALNRVSANFVWNHLSSYRNFAVIPNERVKQFNTFDARLAYQLPILQGTEISLRAQNVFNTKPPYYASGTGYDSSSASPLRRVWQVALRARY